MENIQFDIMSILPEVTVLSMAMLILILDLFIRPKNRFIIYGLSQFTLFAAAWFTFKTHTPAVSYSFTQMFVDDSLADVLK